MFVGFYKEYPIYVSDRKNKKYYAIVDNKKVHFGDNRFKHFFDKMKYYKNLDHKDSNRKRLYYARHGKKAKEGTAKFFSHNILWDL